MVSHSAEVYIGSGPAHFLVARLISPHRAHRRAQTRIIGKIHRAGTHTCQDFSLTRGPRRAFTVHANYFWQWCHRETRSKPRSRWQETRTWNPHGRPRGVLSSIFRPRISWVDERTSVSRRAQKVCQRRYAEISRIFSLVSRPEACAGSRTCSADMCPPTSFPHVCGQVVDSWNSLRYRHVMSRARWVGIFRETAWLLSI